MNQTQQCFANFLIHYDPIPNLKPFEVNIAHYF